MSDSVQNCIICGVPLVFREQAAAVHCAVCGKSYRIQTYCPGEHNICEGCRNLDTLAVTRLALEKTTSTSPSDILELLMSHPSVPMHGAEHHYFVPAAIVAAARNAGFAVREDAVEQAIDRGSRVPGGWCGYLGDCGAAVGMGIATSVLTMAGPLSGKNRTLAMRATSLALASICDNDPRCCKKAARVTVDAAITYLHDNLGLNLGKGSVVVCRYPDRNKECALADCPYHPLYGNKE
jgi:hypothetical protein